MVTDSFFHSKFGLMIQVKLLFKWMENMDHGKILEPAQNLAVVEPKQEQDLATTQLQIMVAKNVRDLHQNRALAMLKAVQVSTHNVTFNVNW